MSSYGSLRLERVEDILRVVIHNPRNDLDTVDEELHAELRQLFAELKHEVEARAVVLTGHGRAFSSARYSAT
jgi:enoyl-CoA hydratase